MEKCYSTRVLVPGKKKKIPQDEGWLKKSTDKRDRERGNYSYSCYYTLLNRV